MEFVEAGSEKKSVASASDGDDSGEQREGSAENVRQTVMEMSGRLKTLEEQRELFLWKYRDVPRKDINDMLKVSHANPMRQLP